MQFLGVLLLVCIALWGISRLGVNLPKLWGFMFKIGGIGLAVFLLLCIVAAFMGLSTRW